MHGGKHPKLVQICTEFPTLIEPSVTHLHACASTHVDSFRAKWSTACTHGQKHQVSSLLCSWGHRAVMHHKFITKVCWLFSAVCKLLNVLSLQLHENEKAHHPCWEPNYFWKQVVSLSIWFKFERTAPCPKAEWFYHLFTSQSTWWQISWSN